MELNELEKDTYDHIERFGKIGFNHGILETEIVNRLIKLGLVRIETNRVTYSNGTRHTEKFVILNDIHYIVKNKIETK
jgi:hypothetical protein